MEAVVANADDPPLVQQATKQYHGQQPIIALLVGDKGVGKSSMLFTWKHESFSAAVPPVHTMVMAPKEKLCSPKAKFVLMDTEGMHACAPPAAFPSPL